MNWNVGYASTTYYGAGCTTPSATTGKCGTACHKGANANYTAAIPLAYWPPVRYGNCPTCGLDCLWNGNVQQNNNSLCFKLTPMVASPSGPPTQFGSGSPIVVQVTDSCGGNCPPGNPLSQGGCSGSSSPDCGDTAMYEGAQIASPAPFTVYVGSNMNAPNAAGEGYRCLDAWDCNAHGSQYWSPCSIGSNSVTSPGFMDWCSGRHMHIDINTESMQGPLMALCNGVAFPGNSASCMVQYERVDCGPIAAPPAMYAQVYSHWEGRNVYCCSVETWGTFPTCAGAQGNLPLCTVAGPTTDCFSPTC